MIDALHKSQAPIWHEDAMLPSPDASAEKSWADTDEDTTKREEGSRIGIAEGAGTDGRHGWGGGDASKERVAGRVRSGNTRK